TQDTGFGSVLPTGEALFPFRSIDQAVAAIEAIEADYPKARRAAFELAREHFDSNVVLGRLLETLGLSLPGRRASAPALPATLDLVPVSRRPTTLSAVAVDASLARPIPETGGDRLGPRRHDTSVVVVAPDGLVFTRLCLESVLPTADDVDLELIV